MGKSYSFSASQTADQRADFSGARTDGAPISGPGSTQALPGGLAISHGAGSLNIKYATSTSFPAEAQALVKDILAYNGLMVDKATNTIADLAEKTIAQAGQSAATAQSAAEAAAAGMPSLSRYLPIAAVGVVALVAIMLLRK